MTRSRSITITVRHTIDRVIAKIESNTLNADAILTTPTRKARQLIEYYLTLVEPNSLHDSVLTRRRADIRFKCSKQINLKNDLDVLFEEFEEVESDMQPRSKYSEIQMMEHIKGLLNSNSDLTPIIDGINVHDIDTSFAFFKNRILEAAVSISGRFSAEDRIQCTRRSSSDIMSSNQTSDLSDVNSSTVMIDRQEWNEMRRAVSRLNDQTLSSWRNNDNATTPDKVRSRSRSNSPFRSNRQRTSTSPSSNRVHFDSFSRRSRSPHRK